MASQLTAEGLELDDLSSPFQPKPFPVFAHDILCHLKDKRQRQQDLDFLCKLSLNWQSGKCMHVIPKACSLVSPKPRGSSQEFPSQSPNKAPHSAYGFYDHSLFSHKHFSPSFLEGCIKGIQMLRFICLLELHVWN